VGDATDLELERAKQLLNRLRTDSLNAWLSQTVRNKQLRDDVKALPDALAVVLGRLQLRMNQQRQADRAIEMMTAVLDEIDYGERYEVAERLEREFGHSWKSEVRQWQNR
jgi:hypothetical protein